MADWALQKKARKKIQAEKKPFIDKNLQLQVSSYHSLNQDLLNPDLGNPSSRHLPSQELSYLRQAAQKAMDEAKEAHKAWKKMQEHLAEMAKNDDCNFGQEKKK